MLCVKDYNRYVQTKFSNEENKAFCHNASRYPCIVIVLLGRNCFVLEEFWHSMLITDNKWQK